MKRDPSIHVKRSSLSEALDKVFGAGAGKEVGSLMYELKGEGLRNRAIIQAKAATKKKAQRVAAVDKDMAEQFHAIYQQVNRRENIKTALISQTDSKYTTLKEVAKQADDFCEMFNLSREHGFAVYVTSAIRLAGNNYSIYRVKSLADRIIQDYENLLKISNDDNEQGTAEIYTAWRHITMKYLGGVVPSVTEPHLYIHFIFAREEADKHKARYEDWIAAQYEKWAGINSTPELSQLYGEPAVLAYNKYMGLANKQYDTKEEKQYFEERKIKPKSPQRRKGKGTV